MKGKESPDITGRYTVGLAWIQRRRETEASLAENSRHNQICVALRGLCPGTNPEEPS